MNASGNAILTRMLERLFAAIVSGPSLNCRPHSSRQRVDLMQLARFGDHPPALVLRELLSETAGFELVSKLAMPARQGAKTRGGEGDEAEGETTAEAAARRAWSEQQNLLSKIRVLVEEARTYESDTGAYVLNIGFPLISLPPGVAAGKHAGTRRILAPIAFIPVSVTVKGGASPAVQVECKSDEVDRVIANDGLLAWIEQNTGKKLAELFTDEEGKQAWKEIALLVRHACGALQMEVPEGFRSDTLPAEIDLVAAPKADESELKPAIIMGAVLGLFPVANQGLLRDTQAMLAGEAVKGPVESFLRADVSLAQPEQELATPEAGKRRPKVFSKERLVAAADPCQARAVALSRTSAGLVIHGPPGTGKSQTITNVIGDHLARGERVLFVCDKRTALDVVANRLSGLGLGSMCAVVHDPQRDQRELYMSIREQLETLGEIKTHPGAEARVGKIDEELSGLHAELTACYEQLSHAPKGSEHSLHDLVGQWLSLQPADGSPSPLDAAAHPLDSVTMAELEASAMVIDETLRRAGEASFPSNPWKDAAGMPLAALVSRPMDHFRGLVSQCVGAGQSADKVADARIPAFHTTLPLEQQRTARAALLAAMERSLAETTQAVRSLWCGKTGAEQARGAKALADARPLIETFRAAPPDAELLAVVQGRAPSAADLAVQIGALEAYLETTGHWWGFLAFGKKGAAAKLLTPLGLPRTVAGATRAKTFLSWLRACMTLRGTVNQLQGVAATAGVPDHEALDADLRGHAAVLEVLRLLREDEALKPLSAACVPAMAGGADAAGLNEVLEGLRRSDARAGALIELERVARGSTLFADAWMGTTLAGLRGGAIAEPVFAALQGALRTLEDVLRVRESLASLPRQLAGATARLIEVSMEPGPGVVLLTREVTAAEISRRLGANPRLQSLDGRRLQTQFSRYRELETEKRGRVKDAVLHRWTAAAKERLLASTGSRLSPAGADVRRRLTTRGKHAMRLRQVLALGRGMEGGDPLMDLRPVWMASPETVAQIFPREQVFDVVIFDEASQCRLEEALPVITRAKRVVIAGDPKQLPPTRFFESTVAQSENDEIESDQQLFEAQQGEVEDLLGAALGLDIQQSYLDVHYRSRNSDLIRFSNEHFYSRRLQPIPGHPKNRARFAPLSLYRAGGVYEDRTNEREAEQVCKIVRELLRRAEPPSIGIGCFNLAQRDLIIEKLDELAVADTEFAVALAAARARRSRGAMEGLFVKNLENVQGDERDHIIISTTYGPDKDGRFYRRFGPLAQPGGGRRLNVLVTRARDEVHLVTSIPREVYTAMPPVPDGQTPSGGWLLFAYLKYAEDLALEYKVTQQMLQQDEAARGVEKTEVAAESILPTDRVSVLPSGTPSAFAEAFGNTLANRHKVGSVIHWGNDGFCIDVALRHPVHPDDVTLGLLCDGTRFTLADDPVEWDIFRTEVLASQGWTIHRLWSPTLFRDLRGQTDEVVRAAQGLILNEEDRDAIRVQKP